MLTSLRVKNLALVENITLELGPGLNTITGETGAGKSILIGALSLLLGERADKSLIRTGEDACGAEASFQLSDTTEVDAVLAEVGLDPCEDGQLVLRRIIRAVGGGQVLVNDSPVTLSALRRLGAVLVDMHGPHDHQSLLQPDVQLRILDAFGHLHESRDAYRQHYETMRALEARREELLHHGDGVDQQLDFLRFRVKELEEGNLDADEEEALRQEHAMVGNAQRILELSGEAVNALAEAEGSAFERMTGVRRLMEDLARMLPEARSWLEETDDLARHVRDLSAAISSMAGGIDADPARLEWLDQRLAIYQALKRKYGGSVSSALEALETAREKLRDLETREERLAELDQELAEVRKGLEQAGRDLHRRRVKVSEELALAITRELQALGFPRGAFVVDARLSEPGRSGMTLVEFGFAPNVGEAMRPLRAIASSGEISRVMLATKVVLAAHDRIPVLVFDEIDANVGGEMGHSVGAKLAVVAATHQVICITHLPQVAAFGTSHVAVTKHVAGERTVTRVAVLPDEDARAKEIARMLGGAARTSVALKHARELLQAAGSS